jgi:hypothetical protein
MNSSIPPRFRDEDASRRVLVEFASTGGVEKVSISPTALAEQSAAALDSAMDTIREMARRLHEALEEAPVRPEAVELAFGLKLDAAAGAFLARAGAEATLNVKLSWGKTKSGGE